MARTNPRLRVEYDRATVVEFLKANEYPVEWTEEMLSSTLMVRAFDDEGTVAYFWGHWIETGVMVFHVCVAKGRYGICFRRSVIRELEQIAFWVGADILLTAVDDMPHASRVRLLLIRQGFEEEPDQFDKKFVYAKNLWIEPDG